MQPAFILFVRSLLILVFALAIYAKTMSRDALASFVKSLSDVPAVSRLNVRIVAAIILVFEIASLLTLAWTPTVRYGFGVAAVSLAILAGGIVSATRSAHVITCQCFGRDGSALSLRHVVRNTLLASTAIVGLILAWANPATPTLSAKAGLLTIATAAIASLLVSRWDDLAFLLVGEIEI